MFFAVSDGGSGTFVWELLGQQTLDAQQPPLGLERVGQFVVAMFRFCGQTLVKSQASKILLDLNRAGPFRKVIRTGLC